MSTYHADLWVEQLAVYIAISLSYFADMETPSRWGKLTVNGGMLPTSMQALDQLDLMSWESCWVGEERCPDR